MLWRQFAGAAHRRDRTLPCRSPRMRGIQYAAAHRSNQCRLGVRSKPGDDTANWGKRARTSNRHTKALTCLQAGRAGQRDHAAQPRRAQINNVGKGIAGNTPASGNEGVGEHVRTRFQISPKAVCGIAEPLFRETAPNEENSFLLPDRALTSELEES
jgi:hypothetical protein